MSLLSIRVTSRSITCRIPKGVRLNSTQTGIRTRLMEAVKKSMKERDTKTSTTLRSLMSEIQAADKIGDKKITDSAVTSLFRKAVSRRNDAASQFIQAARQDLADKELGEVDLISQFLPALLSEQDVERNLGEIFDTLPKDGNPKALKGKLFKAFYEKCDRSLVDAEVLKSKVDALLDN